MKSTKKFDKLKNTLKEAFNKEDYYRITWTLHDICKYYGVKRAYEAIASIGCEYFTANERWIDEDNYIYTVILDHKFEVDLWD